MIRRRRPEEVLYRVGQIVFHRQLEVTMMFKCPNYKKVQKVRGVVMGWDEVAVAPLHWLKQVSLLLTLFQLNIYDWQAGGFMCPYFSLNLF